MPTIWSKRSFRKVRRSFSRDDEYRKSLPSEAVRRRKQFKEERDQEHLGPAPYSDPNTPAMSTVDSSDSPVRLKKSRSFKDRSRKVFDSFVNGFRRQSVISEPGWCDDNKHISVSHLDNSSDSVDSRVPPIPRPDSLEVSDYSPASSVRCHRITTPKVYPSYGGYSTPNSCPPPVVRGAGSPLSGHTISASADVTPGAGTLAEKQEYVYMLLLRSVLKPLGAPDTSPGKRPNDLARHIQEIFEVDAVDHQLWMKNVNTTKPPNVVVNVTIVEAQDLKPNPKSDTLTPYCILGVVKQGSKSPRGSPATFKRRNSILENCEVHQTNAIKTTLKPHWNYHCDFEVKDLSSEYLQVYIVDADETTQSLLGVEQVFRPFERTSGLKGLFKLLRHGSDPGKHVSPFVGQLRIPLKDIPASGQDIWYDLYEDKRQRVKTSGRVNIRTELSAIKQDTYHWGPAERDFCLIEDFYEIIRQMYCHAARHCCVRNSFDGDLQMVTVTQLPSASRHILEQFSVQQNFSRLTSCILELAVILEVLSSDEMNFTVCESVLKKAIENLQKSWQGLQTSHRSDVEYISERAPLITDMEMSLFMKGAKPYIDRTLQSLSSDNISMFTTDSSDQQILPTLFPPHVLQLDHMNTYLGVVINLVNLPLWTDDYAAKKELSDILCQKLKSDVRTWIRERLSTVEANSADPCLQEAGLLVMVLREVMATLTPCHAVSKFFSEVGMDYFKLATFNLESNISVKVKDLMMWLDAYQLRYQNHRTNIRESSAISLRLYTTIRDLFTMVRKNVSERELFKLTMTQYQSWFTNSVVFWLQSFRDECIARTDRAVEIDKDVVQVTSLVKYSNSSVDVLSCFSKITSEWRQIDLADADMLLMGVTKITDTICDGVRHYTEKIETVLERNCYYDLDDNNQFDVTDSCCITLNNIAHVRSFLSELPNLLQWSIAASAVAMKYDDDDNIRDHVMRTLSSLVSSAEEDVEERGVMLLRRIARMIETEIRRYTIAFTQARPEALSSIDPLLHYLQANLRVTSEKLDSSIYPTLLKQIWFSSLKCFDETLAVGRSPEYYQQMHVNLQSLKEYFIRGGIKDATESTLPGGIENKALCTSRYNDLVHRLELNTTPTKDLILTYYQNLEHHTVKSPDYYGQLTVKIGYDNTPDGLVTIHTKVLSASDLPGIKRTGLSDPFVSVTLCPRCVYHRKPQETNIVYDSLNPSWNETISFSGLTPDSLTAPGSCLIFTVWHHDRLLPNDFLGEFILRLDEIQPIPTDATLLSPFSILANTSTMINMLKRHQEPKCGGYQVLKERSQFDKTARLFIKRRSVSAGYEQNRSFCRPVRQILTKVLGKKQATQSRTQLLDMVPVL